MKINQQEKHIFTRKEFKYHVPHYVLPEAITYFNKYLIPDIYNKGCKPYVVRSIYFDSPFFKYYFEKVRGEAIRKKIRVRSYSNHPWENQIFLEVKNKHASKIFKERVSIGIDEYKDFSKSFDFSLLHSETNAPVTDICIHEQKLYKVSPVILVMYRRIAFIDNSIGFKINMDYDISCTGSTDLYHPETDFKSISKNIFVLEIKYRNLIPEYFVDFMKNYDLQREPFSKYSNSIDKIYNIKE